MTIISSFGQESQSELSSDSLLNAHLRNLDPLQTFFFVKKLRNTCHQQLNTIAVSTVENNHLKDKVSRLEVAKRELREEHTALSKELEKASSMAAQLKVQNAGLITECSHLHQENTALIRETCVLYSRL